MNTNITVGTKVQVDETRGLSRIQWSGTVTYNDPRSPYIIVDNIEVRKYEVFPAVTLFDSDSDSDSE